MRAKALRELADHLFRKKRALDSLWQEIGQNFYPERAFFTANRSIGADFASDLLTSYPMLCRRDLGNQFGTMLRPVAKPWFHIGIRHQEKVDTETKQWLQAFEDAQRRAMYDPRAKFTKATKEGDHDFAAFGQCVISTELNLKTNALLYRSWHLRDVAWVEDENGEASTVYRKWKPSAIDLKALFGDKIHDKVAKKLIKTPYDEINVWHIVMPTDQYSEVEGCEKIKQPFVSIYIDIDNDHIMETAGQWINMYTIPRWATVSGSQYAHSPATVVALGDARLIQSITGTLLEAGEKAVNPPMIGIQEAMRSDMSIFAGGFTAVDADYDERLGEVLRPLNMDSSGLRFGMEVGADIREQIMEAFFLNKLSLPPVGGPDMTAYEVGQRVQEYIRNALPLFEPVEAEYNGRLCENTFELLLRAGAFGRPESIPKSIQGSDIKFSFESPLREATEKAKVGQFMEAQQVLAQAISLDPSTALIIDGKKATRDVLEAVAPADWLNSEADVEAAIDQQLQAQRDQAQLDQMQQGAAIAKDLGQANMDEMPA